MSAARVSAASVFAALAVFLIGSFTGGHGSRGMAVAEEKATDAAPPDPATIASLAAVKARLPSLDYQRARFDPIHFKPAIDFASNEACLACHKEIQSDKPREATPAGVKPSETLAWYQTLDTYAGSQATFHWRHLQSPYAKQVMNLSCNFCHQGNDPRERSPHVTAVNDKGAIVTSWPSGAPPFTLRKTVNPSQTCLLCHGKHPAENMGLSGTWPELRADLESPEQPNGCLTCHSDIRTNRHNVSYLNATGIEKAAKEGSDVCFGCHGGRQWYRIAYPYPRHPWPGAPDETPDWAKDRPVHSDPRFELPTK